MQDVVLEPFPRDVSNREVSCIAFSPDGIYLSLARTDNSVHIYDSRMLGKGALHKYRHQDPRFVSPENTLFGVVHAQWVSTRSGQCALLSGGEDGEPDDLCCITPANAIFIFPVLRLRPVMEPHVVQ